MIKHTFEEMKDLSKEEFQKLFESCPVTYTMQAIGGKWKPIVLSRIEMGINRFGQMQRSIPTISKQMLTSQLRELEEDRLIVRKVFAEVPPRVEYSMSEYGKSLMPVLTAMAEWGKKRKAGE